MKITLNRKNLNSFERLVSKLVKQTELPKTVLFSPGDGGMNLTAFCVNATLCMNVPGIEIATSFSLPWSAVKELVSKKTGNLGFDVTDTQITASWLVDEMPQYRYYKLEAPSEEQRPQIPETIMTHSMQLFDVIGEAAKYTDPEHARYVLGSVFLRGTKSQVIATDARQIFCHNGITFPWQEDVACPSSRIFGSDEIREFGETIQVGVIGNQICFQVGDVTFWLNQPEGRHPNLDQYISNTDRGTWLYLDPDDAEFVMRKLDNMPGNTEETLPVYVSLDGSVVIRGHDREQKMATELRLTRSYYEGKELTMSMNRKFLKNAIRFGVNRIGFDKGGGEIMIGLTDHDFTYFWMSLSGNEPVCDEGKLTVLESSSRPASTTPAIPVASAAPAVSVTHSPKQARKKRGNRNPAKPVSGKNQPVLAKAARRVPAESKAEAKPEAKPEEMDPIQEVKTLYGVLFEAAKNVRKLERFLKRQGKQDRIVTNAIASLRQLTGTCG